MLVGSIPLKQLQNKLKKQGLNIKIGPFNINLTSRLPDLARNLHCFYGNYPVYSAEDVTDYHIELKSPSFFRSLIRSQVIFSFDGHIPFKPLPKDQSFAMFEWGLNWCIANNAHQFLIIHAAVVEKEGKAIIFPGSPGSGKSTLCAGLVSQGWRLLSDEMALLSLNDGLIVPVPRPVSLKNQSIDIVKSLSDEVYVGDCVYDTTKGTVAHMKVPLHDVNRSDECATAHAIVFPKYRAGSKTFLAPLSKGYTHLYLAENSFNYSVLGETAFYALTRMIDTCACYNFTYEQLPEAYSTMDSILKTSS